LSFCIFAFTFDFTFHLFLKWSKATKFKKTKVEKRGPDPGNSGRIQTPDLGLGHFGQDFDSGSGPESAFMDPGPRAAFTHGRSLVSVENLDFSNGRMQ
jgi:hypothetical protein